ncbi:MAG: hypothetical protein ACM30I_16425 [Gemmatimonas sp.]
MGTRAMHGGVSTAALLVGAAMLALLSLEGCAAPAALTVAQVAANGATFATTGKSVSDHAMSAVSGQDCSTFGLIESGVLCRDRVAEPEVAVIDAPPPLAQPPARTPLPPRPDNSEATFLALGEFPDFANADRAVVAGRFYSPIVVPLEGDSGQKGASFWVIAGQPLLGSGAVPVAQAKSIGFAGAKTIALCRATYRPGPCASAEPDPQPAVAANAVAAPTPLVPKTFDRVPQIPPQVAERREH